MSGNKNSEPNHNHLSKKLLIASAIVFLGVLGFAAVDSATHNLPSYAINRAVDKAQLTLSAAFPKDPGEIVSVKDEPVYKGRCFSIDRMTIRTSSEDHFRLAVTKFTGNCQARIVPLQSFQRDEPLKDPVVTEGVSLAVGPVNGDYEWPHSPGFLQPSLPMRFSDGTGFQTSRSVVAMETETGEPMGGIIINQKGQIEIADSTKLDTAFQTKQPAVTMGSLITQKSEQQVLDDPWTVLGVTRPKGETVYAFSAYAQITPPNGQTRTIHVVNLDRMPLGTFVDTIRGLSPGKPAKIVIGDGGKGSTNYYVTPQSREVIALGASTSFPHHSPYAVVVTDKTGH